MAVKNRSGSEENRNLTTSTQPPGAEAASAESGETGTVEKRAATERVIDLTAGAHVMMLDAGVFCVYHAPGQQPPGPTGLPGVRINRAPGVEADVVDIATFAPDGWLGATNGAALVRVHKGPAGVLITTYQDPQYPHPAPRLQVMRLIGGVFDDEAAASHTAAGEAGPQEIAAHVQQHGDIGAAIGSWLGEPGSTLWIEGFSITPEGALGPDCLEYQAVLGKKWLSPWAEGGEFCGSRGMALPILGLRARLKGDKAEGWRLRLTATFTDGTRLGPVEGVEEGLEAPSLAPLEAFLLELLPPDGSAASESVTETAALGTKAKAGQKAAPASKTGQRARKTTRKGSAS
ncbi:hypothetical protein [Oecophyllibacter saccharovorans]|uniref:hypothetical protein n=1 Tax=Oecophyllibacter saccharovorans TaxID=2558360 RepID=UPI001F4F3493|nr:hypothetical protein [Oecophyllibacter saccharovorans]